MALNAVGLRGFDALPVIEFNKPAALWDGTETLAYSYRLNVSLHPGVMWRKDLGALDAGSLTLVGDEDQAIDAEALKGMFARYAPRAAFRTLPGRRSLRRLQPALRHRRDRQLAQVSRPAD